MNGQESNLSGREQRLQEVLVACIEAAEAGRAVDRDGVLARYPEFAAELSEFFAGRAGIERLAEPLRGLAPALGCQEAALVQGLPSPRDAATLVKHVAEAVAYAHIEGVIHRDLKPANILIDRHGQPRLTDFGLAKRVASPGIESEEAQLTATGQILGTPSY